MLKILNRTDKDVYEIAEIVSKKLNNPNFSFQEILTILDYGSYKKNTIMYDDETNNIFIYDEESHKMIINQEKIINFVQHVINSSIEKTSNLTKELTKKIDKLTADELKELIK